MTESFIISGSYAGHTPIRNDVYKHQILQAGNEMQSQQANRPRSGISCNSQMSCIMPWDWLRNGKIIAVIFSWLRVTHS